MTRKLFVTAISCLALLGGLCACQKQGGVDRGDINAAIKLTATQVTASSATISAVSAQENVVSCYFVAPVPTSDVKFVDMDAIDRKDYILQHGVKAEMPLTVNVSKSLNAGTSYSVAVIGFDAQGVARTAPYYTTFKTGVSEATVSCDYAEEAPNFRYSYSVILGSSTQYAKYLISDDDAVVEMNDAELEAYMLKSPDTKKTGVSLSEAFPSPKKVSFVVAAIPYDDLDRAGKIAVSRIVVVKPRTIKVGKDLVETSPRVYEGTVKLPAQCTFSIEYEGKDYGFIPYSGNGGVGTVENEFAAVPYYNLTATHHYVFKVEKALGQLAPIADGSNGVNLWTNMASPADVKVVFDLSYADGTPRYYLEVVNTDPKRVFYEGFDLFVYGGFYQAPVKGTGHPILNGGQVTYAEVPNIDGTEPGMKGSIATTTNGVVPFSYNTPDNDPVKDGQPTETFIKNRGLLGWSLKRTSEFPGFIQLGNSQSTHFDAYFVTPKMTALSGATDVVMETETYRFAGDGAIKLAILGAGKFTSATTTVIDGTKAVAGTYAPGCANLSATEFTITGDILPKEANADVNKSILKISIEVSGATADTQFKFYVADETIASNGRIQFDYINVHKK